MSNPLLPHCQVIPAGSILYNDGVEIAAIVNELPTGYVPQPKDFNPELPIGSVYDKSEIKFEGVVIYKHPNFVNPKPCGCGQTKDANGNCDGSHNTIKK